MICYTWYELVLVAWRTGANWKSLHLFSYIYTLPFERIDSRALMAQEDRRADNLKGNDGDRYGEIRRSI